MNTISGHAEATPTGLSFGENLSYAEWESVGFDLAKVGKAMQWWIGDWVNYGGKRYGETYKAAIDATGMVWGSVKNIALVCQSFEMARRHANLKFQHHVEVWSLEPDQQDELLDRAEAEGLSCAKLREIVRSINCIETSEVVDEDDDEIDDLPPSPAIEIQHEESWSEVCVKAFCKVEDRLSVVSEIIKTLEPHERSWLMDLLSRTP